MKSEAPYNPLAAKHHQHIYFLSGAAIAIALAQMAFTWNGPANFQPDPPSEESALTFFEEEEAPRSNQDRIMLPPEVPPPPVAPIAPIIVDPSILPLPDPGPIAFELDFDADIPIDVGGDVPDDFIIEDNKVHDFAEVAPQFGKDQDAFDRYLAENIRYPRCAIENGIEGKVRVSFVVEKDGSLTDLKIHDKLGCGVEEEIRKVFANCPPWNPGIQNGKAVRVSFGKRVDFVLH